MAPHHDTTPVTGRTADAALSRSSTATNGSTSSIVGGGITGLTAAYLLTRGGHVASRVLERERCAQIDTGHTSAHLTMVTDTRLTELVEAFGRDHAQAVWDAGLAAIAQIDAIVARREHRLRLRVGAGLPARAARRRRPTSRRRVPRGGARSRASSGFDATFVDDVPFVGGPGVRFDGQARFHPRKYLAGARARDRRPRRAASSSTRAAEEFSDEPLSVKANGHTRHLRRHRARDAHAAGRQRRHWSSATLFQTKLALYTSYVVGGRVEKGRDARRAVLGHRRSVSLPAPRAASRPRLRDLRRRGSQDRPGRRHRRVLRAARADADGAGRRRRGHASLVGPGDRDAGRPAVHRRDRRRISSRHRILRQRHDVRHARPA